MKSDSGSLPLPALWNGPPKAIVIGVVSSEEPAGTRWTANSICPLETGWLPLKVSRSSVWASGVALAALELLEAEEPQPASTTAVREVMATTSNAGRR